MYFAGCSPGKSICREGFHKEILDSSSGVFDVVSNETAGYRKQLIVELWSPTSKFSSKLYDCRHYLLLYTLRNELRSLFQR